MVGLFENEPAFPFLFSKHTKCYSVKAFIYIFSFAWILLFCIIWNGMSANLFALPIKTSILNAEEQEVGKALVYIDYVELQDMEGTAKGRLGFVNIKGGFQLFVVIDDGQQNLVGSAKNRRLYNKGR